MEKKCSVVVFSLPPLCEYLDLAYIIGFHCFVCVFYVVFFLLIEECKTEASVVNKMVNGMQTWLMPIAITRW